MSSAPLGGGILFPARGPVLRPLLVELGASTPTRGIAFPAGDTDRREEIVASWLEGEWPRLAPALGSPVEPVRVG